MLDYFPILSLSFWKHKPWGWTRSKLQIRFNPVQSKAHRSRPLTWKCTHRVLSPILLVFKIADLLQAWCFRMINNGKQTEQSHRGSYAVLRYFDSYLQMVESMICSQLVLNLLKVLFPVEFFEPKYRSFHLPQPVPWIEGCSYGFDPVGASQGLETC